MAILDSVLLRKTNAAGQHVGRRGQHLKPLKQRGLQARKISIPILSYVDSCIINRCIKFDARSINLSYNQLTV